MPRLGEELLTLAITYATDTTPPRTIWIPKAAHTSALEDRRIRDDILSRKAETP